MSVGLRLDIQYILALFPLLARDKISCLLQCLSTRDTYRVQVLPEGTGPRAPPSSRELGLPSVTCGSCLLLEPILTLLIELSLILYHHYLLEDPVLILAIFPDVLRVRHILAILTTEVE